MQGYLDVEYGILDAIAALHCTALDVLMPLISRLSDAGLIWILIALLCIPKDRKLGWKICLALFLSFLLCNVLLKNLLARPRPFELLEGIELLVALPQDYSFPSGHSSAAFAAASVLFFAHWRWAGLALVLAALTAFSRLYLYVHFPSDVAAGILLGLLIGYMVTKLFTLCESRRGGEEEVC